MKSNQKKRADWMPMNGQKASQTRPQPGIVRVCREEEETQTRWQDNPDREEWPACAGGATQKAQARAGGREGPEAENEDGWGGVQLAIPRSWQIRNWSLVDLPPWGHRGSITPKGKLQSLEATFRMDFLFLFLFSFFYKELGHVTTFITNWRDIPPKQKNKIKIRNKKKNKMMENSTTKSSDHHLMENIIYSPWKEWRFRNKK